MPSIVRVSATIRMTFSLSSRLITGSTLTSASISPRLAAATAVEPAPTPMNEASSGLSPACAIMCSTMKCVLEPGAVTPIFMPLRSAGPL